MAFAITVLLIGVLAVASVTFVIMGARQSLRTRALGGLAHRMGMQFSPQDPFDVPIRYGDFDLVAGGHSPCAHNVIYGRLDGLPLRAFDFRFEIGHGTQRSALHYTVVVMETERPLTEMLMWNARDEQYAPLAARHANERVAAWRCVGDASAAAAVGYACSELTDEAVSAQATGRMLMLCIPARRSATEYEKLIRLAPAALAATARGGASASGEPSAALPLDENASAGR